MYILFTILIVIASVLLTLLVLVQNSKGGGLAAGFSSSNQIMGVRKTTDFLEKATWTLVGIVLLFSIATVPVNKKDVASNESEIREQYQNTKQAEPGVVAPGFGENPQQEQTRQPQQPAK
ncbi:MAG: preprotein translocase subunit SecG [Paludibacter sp.]|nr:preprotein translocase subunit SecG [Paludibacter sp.]